MVYTISQPCPLPVLLTGTSVVRAHEGTRVLSSVEAQAASATGVSFRSDRSAGAGDLQVLLPSVSLSWRATRLSVSASVAGASVLNAVVAEAAGHEPVEAVSVLGLKPAASLAGVGLDARRQVVPVIAGGVERSAASAPLAALVAGGRGRQMQDQQDQFGTTGAGVDGYAFGTVADGTNPIDPRDFRTSSPPG